jgi:hypothetical protein
MKEEIKEIERKGGEDFITWSSIKKEEGKI